MDQELPITATGTFVSADGLIMLSAENMDLGNRMNRMRRGRGGRGGRGLASFDAASAPGDGGASLAAVSSFWPSPASPDHQLDQEPAAA